MSNSTWIVCIDGTWNQPGQTDRDPVSNEEVIEPSNVVKTWQYFTQRALPARAARAFDDNAYGYIAPLDASFGDGAAIYLNGVGGEKSAWLHRLFEGATGTGTSERIRDAYRFLAVRWEPGDRIYGFGFSRGAFAIRSLVGFVDLLGLPIGPRLLKEETLLGLYQIYRDQKPLDTSLISNWAFNVRFDFLGLWDTVGSLAMQDSVNRYHRINPPNVHHVAHALALDEQRKPFDASYWIASHGQEVDETWFRGVHTNIGGGYAGDDLSNITLVWMLNQARRGGLPGIVPEKIPGYTNRDVGEAIRHSYEDAMRKLGLVGQVCEKLDIERIRRRVADGQRIHSSVFSALELGQQPGYTSYEPAAILPNDRPITLDSAPPAKWGTPGDQP